MDKPTGDVKPYLDYLDKEMTIQGVLAAFAVAIIGLVLDKVLGADSTGKSFLSTIQKQGIAFVLLGSGAVALAAVFFYLQRSYLALTYGKIASALAEAASDDAWKSLPLAEYIHWSSYQCGCGLLIVAAAEFALALACQSDVVRANWVWWGSGPFLLGLLCFFLWFKFGAKVNGSSTIAESIAKGLERLLK